MYSNRKIEFLAVGNYQGEQVSISRIIFWSNQCRKGPRQKKSTDNRSVSESILFYFISDHPLYFSQHNLTADWNQSTFWYESVRPLIQCFYWNRYDSQLDIWIQNVCMWLLSDRALLSHCANMIEFWIFCFNTSSSFSQSRWLLSRALLSSFRRLHHIVLP